MEEKTKAEALREALSYQPKHTAYVIDAQETAVSDAFCADYIAFLNACKTERETAAFVKNLAAQAGFAPFDVKAQYAPGDRVYADIHGKALILCTFGTQPLSAGARIVASHIDSPRLDLKPNPLYEDAELAFFKTHYYGGIKKYQWTAIPLALHGVVFRRDGSCVQVCVGEEPGDPQFVVTDLLPHLDRKQGKKSLEDAVLGENLNLLIGSLPFGDKPESDAVKLNILRLLNEKYGIVESDFLSAELEIVPAFRATEIGFDRSLIGAYGHDDRVCAYPALEALLATELPEQTALTVLTDKEEIGSDGNTGLNSAYLRDFITDLALQAGVPVHRVLGRSTCLSADVNACFDPTFPQVHDKLNAAFLNHGAVITKYTGARGKSGSSDAHAEFLGWVRAALDSENVCWQIGELGKVDEGGGGTVAMYIANMNVDVVDLGVPVLSMHAPFELVAKNDVYSTFRACKAYFSFEK